MSKNLSLASALLCSFIWGTTFVAQDTGMDTIGPLTFNGVRFFVGFLFLLPVVFLFEKGKIKNEVKKNKGIFIKYTFMIGIFLFLGTYLQQAALQFTDVANAAFFTIFYVPMVPIILFFVFSKSIHWSIWPSVLFCLVGGYFLTNFSDATIKLGDGLVFVCAIFWALHIIYVGKLIEIFNLPLFLGLLQNLIVALLSIFFGYFYESIIFENILNEKFEILYAGILSGGIAFTLQIYAQKNISAAPAAIIYSLEGVFATIAGWILLSQILGINNVLGCFFILLGVILSQIIPIYEDRKLKI
jgi:drug/metabolite transporter (DMT)-like permease